MEKSLHINGIRLYTGLIQVLQTGVNPVDVPCPPLHQFLSSHSVNMMSMTQDTHGPIFYMSGVIDQKGVADILENQDFRTDVVAISIFPHHYRIRLLASVLNAIDMAGLPIYEIGSSYAMLTFILDHQNGARLIDILRNCFNESDLQIFVEQEGQRNETALFLKQRYLQTHARYEEEKIKTYGIDLRQGLYMGTCIFPVQKLDFLAHHLQEADQENDAFIFVSAHAAANMQFSFTLVTETPMSSIHFENWPVDFIGFHGPHFGDRHSIISRALNCLMKHQVPVLKTNCTGASVGIVLPTGAGGKAKSALMDVFEKP